MADASVVLKLIDQYSAQAKGIEAANKGLSKSMEEAQRAAEQQSKRLNELQSMAAGIKTSMAAAKQELKEAEKQFRATGDAANAEALKSAHEKYDALKSDLGAVTREAKDAERALYNAGEQARRLSSEGSGGGSGGSGGATGGTLATLGKAGLTKLLGSAVSGAAGYAVTSAYGETAGTYFSDILGGAATGAAMGSMAGPVGTLIGGAVGALSGAITAGVKDLTKDDDYFRAGVQNAYDEIMSYRADQISTGSGVQGGRETLLLSYKTLMGGDEAAAQGLYDDLLQYANRTPYTLSQLSEAGRTLLAYGYEGGDIQGRLNQIGAAAAATGSGAQGLSTIATVIGRLNTGEISARLFRSLNSLGMNSYQTLADAYNSQNGTSYGSAEMKELVSKGKVTGEWAAEALLEQWGTQWGASVEEFSRTFEGLTSTYEGLLENRQAAVGEAFNGERAEGLSAEIEYMNSELGSTVSEIEGFYGIVDAHAQNEQERLKRQAEDALVNGTVYADMGDEINARLALAHDEYEMWKGKLDTALGEGDEGAALKAQMNIFRLLDAARADAEAAYTQTDFYNTMQKNNLQLVEDLQASTYDSWYNYGRGFGELFSQGALSVVFGNDAVNIEGGTTIVNGRAGQRQNAGRWGRLLTGSDGSNAYGLGRVPYNGYIAELHEGERVLTASEARQADAGASGVTVNVNVSGATVRSDGDIDAIAEAVAGRIADTMRTFVR